MCARHGSQNKDCPVRDTSGFEAENPWGGCNAFGMNDRVGESTEKWTGTGGQPVAHAESLHTQACERRTW